MKRLSCALLLIMISAAVAQATDDISLFAGGSDFSVPTKIFLLLTLLSLIPTLVIALTSFVRIAVVLSLLRQGMSLHQVPSSQVIVALALILTFYVMWPTGRVVYEQAVAPYMAGEIGPEEALVSGYVPIRDFMLRQTREKDILMFYGLAELPRPKDRSDIPPQVLIPSFMVSELKTAFQMGFMIYLPFLIIDLIMASMLMSMGMLMVPPVMISLPFKLLVFVLADGWTLIVGSLVQSFH